MKIRHLICLLSVAASLVALPLAAQETDAPTTRELVATKLVEYQGRMNLTDYQWNQVQMILKSSIRERLAIARKYGLDGSGEATRNLDRKGKKALRKELKASREGTEDRMKRYLEKDQFKEFKKIQEEIHEAFLQRLEAADTA